MDAQESLQVSFCDLCNTSVPHQDFAQDLAIRHAGKTIGSCCLVAIRGAAKAAASSPVRPSSDSRALPIGIALLAAVASSALFLDYRVGQVEATTGLAIERMREALKSQADVVQDTSVKLDALAARADIDRIEGSVNALQASGDAAAVRMRELAAALDASYASVRALQSGVQRLEAAKGEHMPTLDALRREIQQQSAAIADLAAKPRPAAAEVASAPESAAPAMPMVTGSPGLPAALVHQIGRLSDRDEGVRFEAVDELLRSKDARVLPSLLPLAKDPDTFVRRLVVEGLKDLPSQDCVDTLLVALADPEQIVRSSAWLSLKAMTKQDIPFDSSASREVRQKAQAKWSEWWEKNRAAFGG